MQRCASGRHAAPKQTLISLRYTSNHENNSSPQLSLPSLSSEEREEGKGVEG